MPSLYHKHFCITEVCVSLDEHLQLSVAFVKLSIILSVRNEGVRGVTFILSDAKLILDKLEKNHQTGTCQSTQSWDQQTLTHINGFFGHLDTVNLLANSVSHFNIQQSQSNIMSGANLLVQKIHPLLALFFISTNLQWKYLNLYCLNVLLKAS